ncbi:MAG TPA: amidohydrolase family protein [Polyangiaceae bacterium]|nr:amidohydrolase family protein [Polyangiaceae bacterium]
MDSDSGGADATTDASPGDPTLAPNAPPKVTECNQPALTPPASGTCSVTAGTTGKVLRGTVLLPNEVLHRGEVLVDDAGQIVCAACDCSASPNYAQATVVACADGVISPGLINPHDHIEYANNAPVGHGTERYDHRNEWRDGLDGHTALSYKSGASGAVQLFAELRFVMGGATSTVCVGGKKGLARNLDSSDPQLFERLPVQQANADTFPLDDSSGTMLTSGCAYGANRTTHATVLQSEAYLPHIAEGVNAAAHNEYLCTSDANGQFDLMEPPTAIIHGIAALPSDVAPLRSDGAHLVWSPRSNVDLYGNTASITMFDALGVPIALGTDWVASGSMNLLRELKCADSLNQQYFARHFTDADLWRMVTYNAAWAAGAADVVGALKPGYAADIAIFDGKTSKDHRAVIDAGVEDVVLVLRGGKVLYGDDALVADPAIGGQACETLDTCGRAKRACVAQDVGGTTTLASIRTAGEAYYPLFFCKSSVPTAEPSCVPYRTEYAAGITATDRDGDGIDDGADDCPTIFNPIRPMDNGVQSDVDGDGVGDACDRCPTDATNHCQNPPADDFDGDGVPNGVDDCPSVADPQQADADGDGRGDACDTCPNVANPGETPCALTLEQMRNPQDAKHPKLGAVVSLPPAYVTAVSSGGFSLQDISLLPYSGVWVIPGTAAPGLKRGNQVAVTGVYLNPYGQAQVEASSVTIVDPGTSLPFSPITASPADIKTGGAMADAYQSMLLVLSNVTVTNDTPDGTGKFYEFVVDNGCRVDDLLYAKYGTTGTAYPPAGYTNGSTFTSLAGVLGFSYGNSKLWPRDAADIVP